MHGYATFNMLVPGPQNCCRYEMYTASPRTSIVRGNCLRETSVKRRNKIVQEIRRNVANVFSFYAISDRTWFFNALTFARSLGRCWKPWPPASVFNTSLGTWRMLVDEKNCLIPILTSSKILLAKWPWSDLMEYGTSVEPDSRNLIWVYARRIVHKIDFWLKKGTGLIISTDNMVET